MKEIQVGSMVYVLVNGMRGVITSMPKKVLNIGCSRVVDQEYNVIIGKTNTLISGLRRCEIAPACDHIFDIGDKVCSTLGGGFVGEVTGYEKETNRVICKSSKGNNDRVRYSYGIDEIEIVQESFIFEVNGKYKINSKENVRVISCSAKDANYIVFKEQDGKALLTLTTLVVPYDQLTNAGVTNIQKRK